MIVKLVIRFFFELVQWVLLGICLPFHFIGRWSTRGAFWWQRTVYYQWIKLKRRALGEAPWQPHDMMIGVAPPADWCPPVTGEIAVGSTLGREPPPLPPPEDTNP